MYAGQHSNADLFVPWVSAHMTAPFPPDLHAYRAPPICDLEIPVAKWGAVERQARRYDWSGYRQLFEVVKNFGLRIQVVLSFHSCGGNVGDSAQIPLPKWVLKVSSPAISPPACKCCRCF